MSISRTKQSFCETEQIRSLTLFQQPDAITESTNGEFIIVNAGEWYTKPNYCGETREFVVAVREAAKAGCKIALEGFHNRPYVSQWDDAPTVESVVEIVFGHVDFRLLEMTRYLSMTWAQIVELVRASVNEKRQEYNDELKSIYKVVAAQSGFILLPIFEPCTSHTTNIPRELDTVYVHGANLAWFIPGKSMFDNVIIGLDHKGFGTKDWHWVPTGRKNKDEDRIGFSRRSGLCIASGQGELKQVGDDLIWEGKPGACYLGGIETQTLSLSLTKRDDLKPIPMLDEESLWQEVIFDPEPLSKEPAVGPYGIDVTGAMQRRRGWNPPGD